MGETSPACVEARFLPFGKLRNRRSKGRLAGRFVMQVASTGSATVW
jgi:hypothetical protein